VKSTSVRENFGWGRGKNGLKKSLLKKEEVGGGKSLTASGEGVRVEQGTSHSV